MPEEGAGGAFALSLRERPPAAPFAVGVDPRSWNALLSDAASVARLLPGRETLPARDELMVACADRYHSAVALLACWRAGYVAGLPPNGNPRAIDQLCASRGIPLVLHDGGGSGGVDLRVALAGAPPATAPTAEKIPSFPSERTLVCVYTSGSTGDHVACPKTAGQLLGEALLLTELFGLGPDARILATVPPHHIYGLLFGLLVPLMGGGVVVRGTPHHAETIAEQARKWGVNVLVSVPAHLHGLSGLPAGVMPALGRVFSSGAPLPGDTARLLEAQLGTRVSEVYGSSETGGIAWRPAGGREGWRPFPGVLVESDQDGSIVVVSPFAPRQSEMTDEMTDGLADGRASRFVGADLIAKRGNGDFDLLGRADNIVKIGGSRISTAEVERRLLEIPGVREAAVVAVEVPGPRQHELWAVVAGPARPVAELRAALLRSGDAISVPRRFRIVDALPREDNGKLVRQRLLTLFAETRAADGPAAPSVTVAAADGEVREVHVAVDSPFFQGHFAGFPVLPGVVQVNDLVLGRIRARWPDLLCLRRIISLKFRSPIRPGDTITVELRRAEAGKVAFHLRAAGGALISSGTCVFDGEGARGGPGG